MMYRRDESGNIRAYDRDWANNEWHERTYPIKKNPCISDNSTNNCIINNIIDNEAVSKTYNDIDYEIIKNINNIHDSTINIIKIIKNNIFKTETDTGKKYIMIHEECIKDCGKELPIVCEELKKLGICHIIPCGGYVELVKINTSNINDCYVSIFYDINEDHNNFRKDVDKFYNDGFKIYSYMNLIFYDFKENVSKLVGYMATFKKIL